MNKVLNQKNLVLSIVVFLAVVMTGCPAVVSGGSGSGSGNTGGGGNGDGQGNSPLLPASFDPSTGIGTIGSVQFTMKKIQTVTNQNIGDVGETDNTVHAVSLTAYMIGETEVTQELYTSVMNTSNPSGFTDSIAQNEVPVNRPIENVTWYDCLAFCNELTRKTTGLGESECVYYSDPGLSVLYTKTDAAGRKEGYQAITKKGFRLPTEVEWEWAARGGQNHTWAGTNTQSELETYAWVSSNSDSKTHEVKKKTENTFGLYDMSGNVAEWCWDWYAAVTRPTGCQDPEGAVNGTLRVVRGGGWTETEQQARCYNRQNKEPGSYDNKTGFRIVCRP